VIDKAARADMDRRWLVADVTTWYPVNEEPQRHFTDAVAAYAKKDYKAAAADIRKATGYLRLEAGRATGETKQKLDSSVAELDTLAASVEKGLVQDKQSMAIAFAHGKPCTRSGASLQGSRILGAQGVRQRRLRT